MADEYYNEILNFGGELTSRYEIIQYLKGLTDDPRLIDMYLFGLDWAKAHAQEAHILPMAVATQDTRHDAPNEIVLYYHCAQCLAEKPENISPRDWSRLSVGVTPMGAQVWCDRHNVNVAHIRWAEDERG